MLKLREKSGIDLEIGLKSKIWNQRSGRKIWNHGRNDDLTTARWKKSVWNRFRNRRDLKFLSIRSQKSRWNLSEISEESRGLETEIVSGLMMEEITSKGGGSKNTSYKGGADTVTTKDPESRTRPDGQTPKTNVGRRQFGPAPAMNQL